MCAIGIYALTPLPFQLNDWETLLFSFPSANISQISRDNTGKKVIRTHKRLRAPTEMWVSPIVQLEWQGAPIGTRTKPSLTHGSDAHPTAGQPGSPVKAELSSL